MANINHEIAREIFQTRKHGEGGKNIKTRRMVSDRSKAGLRRSLNHFTATEPKGCPLTSEENRTVRLVRGGASPRYLVVKGKRTLAGPFGSLGQAENKAFELSGTVRAL